MLLSAVKLLNAIYMQPIRYFWNTAVALDRTVLALDEGQRFPLCQPEPLRQLFQANTTWP